MKIKQIIAVTALLMFAIIGEGVETSSFSWSYKNQKLDSVVRLDGKWQKAKHYRTDLSHITQRYGLMVMISDPEATITVLRLYRKNMAQKVELEVLEVTSNYKIVDVMDPTLERVVIIVTSPHTKKRFDIYISAICE